MARTKSRKPSRIDGGDEAGPSRLAADGGIEAIQVGDVTIDKDVYEDVNLSQRP